MLDSICLISIGYWIVMTEISIKRNVIKDNDPRILVCIQMSLSDSSKQLFIYICKTAVEGLCKKTW